MKQEDRGIISSYDFKKVSVKLGYSLMVLVIVCMAITMLYPFFNTFFSSLKTREEFFSFPPTFFPKDWIWKNYYDAWTQFDLPLLTFLKNTILIYVGNMVFSLLFIGLAAFALSHLKVPFKKWVTLYFLATLLIPPATYIVPNFLNLKSLGLINTYWAFWLPAAVNAYFMLLLKNFLTAFTKKFWKRQGWMGPVNLNPSQPLRFHFPCRSSGPCCCSLSPIHGTISTGLIS